MPIFFQAASAGHTDIVRLLIAHGADVNAQSRCVSHFCKQREVHNSDCKSIFRSVKQHFTMTQKLRSRSFYLYISLKMAYFKALVLW